MVPLASEWPAELDITGDSQAAVDKADDAHAVTLFGKLVDQDRAMFGFRHWQTMHILVSQSEGRPFDGLEHEDSLTTELETPAFPRKINWKNTARGFWPTNSHTPGTASIGARRSCIRSPTIKGRSGLRCSGYMRV